MKMTVFHHHEMSHHSGNSYALAQIRQMFWIVNGQSTARFYLKTCFHWSLRRAKAGRQVMAPLPLQRITGGERPFSITGVDFFGPEWVNIRYGETTSRKRVKRYGCLFTCCATRAVHLEVCNSLSTDSFMCAFKRFLCSRDFSTRQVWSDQGTNLVGASNEMKQALENRDENKIAKSLSACGVE